jgi:hypothetical protein
MTITAVSRGVRACGSYVATRFPPHTLGVAIALTYTSIAFTTSRLIHRPVGQSYSIPGLTAFFACFLLMRLIDDIDDLAADGAADSRRKPLLLAAALCATLILAVSAICIGDLVVAVLFVAFVVGTPWWVKRRMTRHRGVLALCYELVPFLAMGEAEAASLPPEVNHPPVLAVVVLPGVFGACYEFWKLSRRFHRPDYPIYDLSPRSLCLVLVALWAVISAGSLYVAGVSGFGHLFMAYVVVVTAAAVFVVVRMGLARIRSRPTAELPERFLLGIPLIVLLDLGYLSVALRYP